MMKQMFKVLSQSEAISVQRQDGSVVSKSTIVLQEIGGKFENSYAAVLLGNAATVKFSPDDIVLAALRFVHREYNGNVYQDVTVQEIITINK